MATEVLRRRGTTTEHSSFTGGVAELTVDLDKDTVVVHDGATSGGFPLLREDVSNNATLTTYVDNSLTAVELQQLQNINSETISNTQWSYLGLMDQGVATTDNVTFNQGTFNGELNANEDAFFAKSLFVDGGLYTEEFVVEQNRLISEFRMGPTGGKIETISDNTVGAEKIVFSDQSNATIPVDVDSIVLIQTSTGLNSGTIIKQIYRRVSDIDPDGDNPLEVQLTDSGITWTAGTANDDVGVIAVGDYAVGVGHTSSTLLDHYIHFDVAAVDIPAIRFWDGVDDVGGGSEFMRIGGLDGFQSFGSQDVGIGIGTAHYLQANANGGAGRVSFSGGIIEANTSTVDFAAFTANSEYLTNGQTYIGENLDQFNDPASGRILIGDFGTSGNDPRIYAIGGMGAGSARFRIIQNAVLGNDSNFDQVFKIDLSGGDEHKIGGTYFDSTDQWLGSATKGNATVLLDGTNGQIYYDAMGGPVYAKSSVAGFLAGESAPSITSEAWKQSVTDSFDDGTFAQTQQEKIRVKYFHRFGIEKVIVKGFHRVVESGDPAASSSAIVVDVGGVNQEVSTASSTFNEFQLDVDVTSLTPGTFYEFIVTLRARCNLAPGGSSASAQAELREDVYIVTST